MPYGCARAVCATFCWHLRWALTPIFGPSFLRDCIPPSSVSFQCFRIAPEVIRVCEREAEGWRGVEPRSYTPMSDNAGHIAPSSSSTTSAPRPIAIPSPKRLRPRKHKAPLLDSPFSTDFEDEEMAYSRSGGRAQIMDSPSVSPKTRSQPLLTSPSPVGPRGWATVNNPQPPFFAIPAPPLPARQATLFPDVGNFIFSPSATATPLVANQRMLYPTASAKRTMPSTVDEHMDADADVDMEGSPMVKKARLSYKCKARDFNAAKTLMMLHDADRMLAVPPQQDIESDGEVMPQRRRVMT